MCGVEGISPSALPFVEPFAHSRTAAVGPDQPQEQAARVKARSLWEGLGAGSRVVGACGLCWRWGAHHALLHSLTPSPLPFSPSH